MSIRQISAVMATVFCLACQRNEDQPAPIEGTWQLLTGTLIEKGDTVVTDYTVGNKMIKIINKTHFAFLNHNVDSSDSAMFVAGGGNYTLKGDAYTEHLEYCSDRAWEGHSFDFKIKVVGDTLTQTGREVVEAEKIDRLNIEKYMRLNR